MLPGERVSRGGCESCAANGLSGRTIYLSISICSFVTGRAKRFVEFWPPFSRVPGTKISARLSFPVANWFSPSGPFSPCIWDLDRGSMWPYFAKAVHSVL